MPWHTGSQADAGATASQADPSRNRSPAAGDGTSGCGSPLHSTDAQTHAQMCLVAVSLSVLCCRSCQSHESRAPPLLLPLDCRSSAGVQVLFRVLALATRAAEQRSCSRDSRSHSRASRSPDSRLLSEKPVSETRASSDFDSLSLERVKGGRRGPSAARTEGTVTREQEAREAAGAGGVARGGRRDEDEMPQ